LFSIRYWRNYTFHVLTDQPWTIPKPAHIIDFQEGRSKSPIRDEGAIKVWAVRDPATTWEVNDKVMGWDVIIPERAREIFGSAGMLDSPMVS